jgi:hypothetical protein
MALIALSTKATADRAISIVRKPAHNDQASGIAGEAIVAGAPVRLDTTTGRFMNALGTTAPNARVIFIATRTVATGEAMTGVRGCTLEGYVLDTLAYDAPVYLSDTSGRLGDAAGTVSVVIGRVVPGFATTLGTAADKLLDVTRLA